MLRRKREEREGRIAKRHYTGVKPHTAAQKAIAPAPQFAHTQEIYAGINPASRMGEQYSAGAPQTLTTQPMQASGPACAVNVAIHDKKKKKRRKERRTRCIVANSQDTSRRRILLRRKKRGMERKERGSMKETLTCESQKRKGKGREEEAARRGETKALHGKSASASALTNPGCMASWPGANLRVLVNLATSNLSLRPPDTAVRLLSAFSLCLCQLFNDSQIFTIFCSQ